MPTSSTVTAVGEHRKQEDNAALLTRFVRSVPIVYSHLTVADSSLGHGKAIRQGFLSTSMPNLQSVTY